MYVSTVESILLWVHPLGIKYSKPLEEWCDDKCLDTTHKVKTQDYSHIKYLDLFHLSVR